MQIIEMYTGQSVSVRSFALGVALLVAGSPVIGLVCALDCDRPPATASACHSRSTTSEASTLRGTTHVCGHRHVSEPPALLTGTTGRQHVVPSFAAAPLDSVRTSLSVPAIGAVLAMHDPPGLKARTAKSLTTVLRI
jgi:hypothetical protein